MFIFIPIIGGVAALIGAVAPMVIPVAGVVGGLIVAPAVLKASSNAVSLIKDGKVGLEVQQVIKRISDYDEQIGNIIIEKDLEFDNDMFTNEINKIKENLAKIEEKNKELEQLKEKE